MNQPCLELIEGRLGNVGVLNKLDDSGGMGSAAEHDVNFLAQLHQKFGGVTSSSTMDGMSTSKKEENAQQEPRQGITMPSELYHTKNLAKIGISS